MIKTLTPRENAEELYYKFDYLIAVNLTVVPDTSTDDLIKNSKECTLLACHEIVNYIIGTIYGGGNTEVGEYVLYWRDVIKEVNDLYG